MKLNFLNDNTHWGGVFKSPKHFKLTKQLLNFKHHKLILATLILLPLLSFIIIQTKTQTALGNPDTPSEADLVFHPDPASTIPECEGWSECFAFTIDTRLDGAENVIGGIPTESDYSWYYSSFGDWNINWGDGTTETKNVSSSSALHTYTVPGEYRITLRPNVADNSLAPDGWMNAFGTDSYNYTGAKFIRSINSPITDKMRKNPDDSINQAYRFAGMFFYARDAIGIPSGLFDQIDTSNGTNFYGMFSNTFHYFATNSIDATIPDGLFDSIDTSKGTNFGRMFHSTFYGYAMNSTIATIPVGLFDQIDTSNGTDFSSMFNVTFHHCAYSSTIGTIPAGLFDSIDTGNGINLRAMFLATFLHYATHSITGTVPSDLFDSIDTNNGTDFLYMFQETLGAYSHRKAYFDLGGGYIVESLTQTFARPYFVKIGEGGTSTVTAGDVIKPSHISDYVVTKPSGIFGTFPWYTKDGTPCHVANPTPDCGAQNSDSLVSFPYTGWTPETPTEKGNITFYVPRSIPAPTITAISPNQGPVIGGTTVEVTGTGLLDIEYITFGGIQCDNLTIISDTELTCDSPAHIAEIVDVVLTTTDNQTTTLTYAFTYLDDTPPSIPPTPPTDPTNPITPTVPAVVLPVDSINSSLVVPGAPNTGVRRVSYKLI